MFLNKRVYLFFTPLAGLTNKMPSFKKGKQTNKKKPTTNIAEEKEESIVRYLLRGQFKRKPLKIRKVRKRCGSLMLG